MNREEFCKHAKIDWNRNMNREEFCKHAKIDWNDITTDDWHKISTVYIWHPMISNTKGKSEIAALYNVGNMGIINDMLPTAEELAGHYSTLQGNSAKLEYTMKVQKTEMDQMKERHAHQLQNIKDSDREAAFEIKAIEKIFSKELK